MGKMDELAVWNRSLTAEEVTKLYANKLDNFFPDVNLSPASSQANSPTTESTQISLSSTQTTLLSSSKSESTISTSKVRPSTQSSTSRITQNFTSMATFSNSKSSNLLTEIGGIENLSQKQNNSKVTFFTQIYAIESRGYSLFEFRSRIYIYYCNHFYRDFSDSKVISIFRLKK